ncbi:Coenzyme F420 hydrogenase/dehydrogenase, beta subunit C-terminal domain [Pseudoflavonifractor phocaeensis]|uniref:Coenzyme F420 hydrogenase/dehydrogenase, beta subunit C-terminal domain n=1 Tax=Pseudoflavonifractor phocaeensis TaxID=1870988 RepID=UPI00195CA416|nr:Coenzyme F420 hydrogenase/dehydrogenase, beta subunit C-terminal domain [Pseudoflavonifractor phocaeensis]MBM6871543.1 Coenzyme F420 hydrogenase/dehydrogenase, beta subunit C-terminal domain [Pseudoflavonifractor phocaeensis]MBM6937458.1 Coenzyme F420 hydrogenase/dehydrogenase, beta subunit C-terminal domain [Pseudoflavonifractor phocaeensis]
MPELAKKTECTGCTACASVCPKQCIKMVRDEEGFAYPEVDLHQCVDCMLCVKSCPIKTNDLRTHPTPSAYAAYSNAAQLREESSSGGIFSEIAMEIFNRGGVVFGAAYDTRFEVRHVCIETADELYRLRGAKYVQSTLDGVFLQVKDYLQRQREVLFSGTPCQIAGLKAFLKEEYPLLTCIDFVCHGVPSPAVWREYVRYRSRLDNNGDLPRSINMRSKESGWSRYQYSNTFVYGQKRWSSRNQDNLFMRLFVGGYINRACCENCKAKGYDRTSDITLGDFWGIWEVRPEMDDDKGTSLVLLHSEKARRLFDAIHDRIRYQPVSLEEASWMNPSLLQSSKAKGERAVFIKSAIDGAFDQLEERLGQDAAGRKGSLFRRAGGWFRRLLQGK